MNFIKIFLNWSGRYIEKNTSKQEIKNLIKKMKPIAIDKKLIRIGDNNDGGYILPDDFDRIKHCFSAGVGNLIKFEEDLFKRNKIKSFLCDYNNLSYLTKKNYFNFTKKKISCFNDINNISLNKWINNRISLKDEFILKIDIEGSEFDSLLNISDDILKKVRILVVEFHSLRDLRNKSFYRIFDNVISRLLHFFYIVHLHPNNAGKIIEINNYEFPDLLEITFYKKNRVSKKRKFKNSYPLDIDQKNIKEKKDIYLPSYWTRDAL